MFIIFFLVVLEFELKGLALAKQIPTTWTMPLALIICLCINFISYNIWTINCTHLKDTISWIEKIFFT
jgi:hypothetical protein